MGAAILGFYCTLVDVLGRCAPEPSTIAQGKNDCLRARAILRSLVPMEDLEGVLALRFTLLTPTNDGKNLCLFIYHYFFIMHSLLLNYR